MSIPLSVTNNNTTLSAWTPYPTGTVVYSETTVQNSRKRPLPESEKYMIQGL